MSENTNSPAESGSERELTELEKSIVSDFKQLNEENQLAVIDFILSLLIFAPLLFGSGLFFLLISKNSSDLCEN